MIVNVDIQEILSKKGGDKRKRWPPKTPPHLPHSPYSMMGGNLGKKKTLKGTRWAEKKNDQTKRKIDILGGGK